MSIKSELEKTAQHLRNARKAVIGRGGEISPTAGLAELPDAIFNIPTDIALAYQTDDATAYEKTVPSNAEEYARVGKVGGMSRRSINLLEPVDWQTKTANGYTVTRLLDGSVRITGAALEAVSTTIDIAAQKVGAGNTIKYVYLDRNKSYYFSAWHNGEYTTDIVPALRIDYTDETGGRIWKDFKGVNKDTRPRAITRAYLQFTPKVGDTSICGIWGAMITEGTQQPTEFIPYYAGLRNASVDKIKCRDVDGNIIGIIAVPEAVKAIDGYGKGVNSEYYNYLLWTANENGKPRVQFVQNTFRKVFDGTENITVSAVTPFPEYTYTFGFNATSSATDTNLVCNHYIPMHRNGVYSREYVGIISVNDNSFKWKDFSMTTAEMQAKLREWYAYGDPLTCEFILAEPIITDITDLIDPNMFIKVAGGGKVIFENEHKEAVPSEITYLVETVGG